MREDSVVEGREKTAGEKNAGLSHRVVSNTVLLTLSQGNATLHLYPHFRPLLEFKGKTLLLQLFIILHFHALSVNVQIVPSVKH